MRAPKGRGNLKKVSRLLHSVRNDRRGTYSQRQKMNMNNFWHTSSHILAQAVKRLYPEVQLGIGPAIENGFYYDFYREDPFTPEDLRKIEKEMAKIVKEDIKIKRIEKGREDAEKLLKEREERFKLELLKDLDEKVSFYQQGDFIDLCSGPHLTSTGEIKAFSLLSVASSYWKGNEERESMQRIYGISFPTREELESYLKNLKEAKERDHRKLGRELDLFDIYPEAGKGLVFWHPKGAIIRHIIEDFLIKEHLKRGYNLLYTPHLANLNLWKTSGHWDFYREYMFPPFSEDKEEFIIRPMNCPGHILVYKSRLRSYRELPLRFAELGTVYRLEKSGVLHGLLRVRGFTQDDGHIFTTEENLEEEIEDAIKLAIFVLNSFGFSRFEVLLSTRPEKFVGSLANWKKAETALKKGLEKSELTYTIDPGEGVFYGPKIDIKIKDSLGRRWQCSTIQVDFNLPERFNVSYIDKNGKEAQPIMIHRALLGSLERFFGVLIEYYKGSFPLWLSPVQVSILPITDKQISYSKDIEKSLREAEIRVKSDLRSESINKKIREAELEKIPYLLILGKREEEKETLSVRKKGEGQIGEMTLPTLLSRLKKEIEEKK